MSAGLSQATGKFAHPLAQPYVDYSVEKGLNTVLGPESDGVMWDYRRLGEVARPLGYLGLFLFIGGFISTTAILLPSVEGNPVLAEAILSTAVHAIMIGMVVLGAGGVCWLVKRSSE